MSTRLRRSDRAPPPAFDQESIGCASAIDRVALPTHHEQKQRARRVTIVDDDPMDLEIVSSILAADGFDVSTAISGEEFIHTQATNPKPVDVLVTDVHMPGMDGFELLEHVREDDPTLSVVVMTADDGYESVSRALALGAIGYLGKPFGHVENVRQAVNAAASATHLVRANQRLVEQLNTQNEQLRKIAMTDALTGAYNRRYVDRVINAHVERSVSHGLALSIILFDLDFFKSVNDTHGHEAGDVVLCHVAREMRTLIRTEDSIGRYGGEEFVVVLPDTGPADAVILCDRLCRHLAESAVDHEGLSLQVTASFGIAGVDADTTDVTARDLMTGADRAVYEAKRLGRNRVVLDTLDRKAA